MTEEELNKILYTVARFIDELLPEGTEWVVFCYPKEDLGVKNKILTNMPSANEAAIKVLSSLPKSK